MRAIQNQSNCINKGISTLSNNLYVEVCGDNEELKEAFDHLHMEWIGTKEFVRAIRNYFTNNEGVVDAHVIGGTLNGGVKAYALTLNDSSRHYYPNDRLRVFLEGCLRNACKLGNTEDDKINDLLCSSDSPEEGVICSEMYMSTVPRNFKHAMRRFKHEAALLACPMAYSN